MEIKLNSLFFLKISPILDHVLYNGRYKKTKKHLASQNVKTIKSLKINHKVQSLNESFVTLRTSWSLKMKKNVIFLRFE